MCQCPVGWQGPDCATGKTAQKLKKTLKIVEFTIIVNPHEAAHGEPPYKDLHCLLSS